MLLGTLLVPLGLMPGRSGSDPQNTIAATTRRPRLETSPQPTPMRTGSRRPAGAGAAAAERATASDRDAAVARRDTERLRQILVASTPLDRSGFVATCEAALMHRGPFQEALVWLEIHGRAPEALEDWRGFIDASGPLTAHEAAEGAAAEAVLTPQAPRRRRRRGRRRGGGGFNRFASFVTLRAVRLLRDLRAFVYPCLRSKSCMNSTSASTPSSGNAL